MSAAHHVTGAIDSVVIAESADGDAGLIQEGLPIGTRDVVVIPKADRVAVALALLGDRDALVDRVARALHDSRNHRFLVMPFEQCDVCPADAKAIVAAIAGGEGAGK